MHNWWAATAYQRDTSSVFVGSLHSFSECFTCTHGLQAWLASSPGFCELQNVSLTQGVEFFVFASPQTVKDLRAVRNRQCGKYSMYCTFLCMWDQVLTHPQCWLVSRVCLSSSTLLLLFLLKRIVEIIEMHYAHVYMWQGGSLTFVDEPLPIILGFSVMPQRTFQKTLDN